MWIHLTDLPRMASLHCTCCYNLGLFAFLKYELESSGETSVMSSYPRIKNYVLGILPLLMLALPIVASAEMCPKPRSMGVVEAKQEDPPQLTLQLFGTNEGECTSLVERRVSKKSAWQEIKNGTPIIADVNDNGVIHSLSIQSPTDYFLYSSKRPPRSKPGTGGK